MSCVSRGCTLRNAIVRFLFPFFQLYSRKFLKVTRDLEPDDYYRTMIVTSSTRLVSSYRFIDQLLDRNRLTLRK